MTFKGCERLSTSPCDNAEFFWWQGARRGLRSWQVDAGAAQSPLLMNASAPASSLEGHGVQSTDRHALTIDGVESTDSVSGNDETGGPALNPKTQKDSPGCQIHEAI